MDNRILLATASLAMLAATGVQAQEAPVAGGSADPVEGDPNAIIVTAQFRAEDSQDVPIAISAFTPQTLEGLGIENVPELQQVTPSFQFNSGLGSFAQARIRSVGTSGSGPGIENPVATYVDGVYVASAAATMFALNDIEQVAILRGPQGTLFGRNATGGLVQVTTRDPQFTPAVDADITIGNYDTVVGRVFATAPLSETVAISVGAIYDNQDDGFGTNLFTGTELGDHENYALRGKLLIAPTDSLTIKLAGDYSEDSGTYPNFRGRSFTALGTLVPGGPRDSADNFDPFTTVKQHGASLTIENDFDGVSFTSVSAYRKTHLDAGVDLDRTSVLSQSLHLVTNFEQFSQEVRLLSDNDGPFQWVIGGMYLHTRDDYDPSAVTVPPGVISTFAVQRLDSFSGFVQVDYNLSDRTKVTGGLRYTIDQRNIDFENHFRPAGTTLDLTTAAYSADRSFKDFSWRLSLDHQFSDDLLGYASYNRGFKSGTFLPSAVVATVLQPEVLDAFEVGLKSDLADGAVRLNASAFYYDYSNPQLNTIIQGSIFLYNAESATTKGLELDANLQATNRLSFIVGASYIDATYGNFPSAALTIPITPTFPAPAPPIPNGGNLIVRGPCPGFGGAAGNPCDATGNRVQNTPEYTFNLGTTYDIPTSVGDFVLGANWYHNGGFFPDADNRLRVSSYDVFNASLGWTSLDGRYEIQLWAKNIGNKDYPYQALSGDSGDAFVYAPPRTYGLTAGVHF